MKEQTYEKLSAKAEALFQKAENRFHLANLLDAFFNDLDHVDLVFKKENGSVFLKGRTFRRIVVNEKPKVTNDYSIKVLTEKLNGFDPLLPGDFPSFGGIRDVIRTATFDFLNAKKPKVLEEVIN